MSFGQIALLGALACGAAIAVLVLIGGRYETPPDWTIRPRLALGVAGAVLAFVGLVDVL